MATRQPEEQLWSLFRLSMRDARNPLLVMWGLYIVAFPFYLFDSGLPQPADWLMAVLIALALAATRAKPPSHAYPAMRSLALFVGYAVLINLMWSVALDSYSLSTKHGLLRHPLFYIYNLLLFFTGLRLYGAYGRQLIRVTAVAVMVCVAIQLAASFFHLGRAGLRPTLFFNSPNQLGYFGLLAGSVFAFTMREVRLPRYLEGAVFAACAYLALMSASKAAVVGLGALAIISFLTRPTTLIVGGLALAGIIAFYEPADVLIDRSMERISKTGEGETDNLEGRGYDRIWNHQEYLVIGAGEGAYARFPSAIGNHEIHSSIGTLLFCYGALGTVLFAAFALRCLNGHGVRGYLLGLPTALYGLTHQGLRFGMFWVLLVIIVATSTGSKQSRGALPMRPIP